MKNKNIPIYIGIIVAVALMALCILNYFKKPLMINLQLVSDNFVSPVKLVEPPDNTGRLFVADRIGVVKIVKNKSVLDEPFLDLRENMVELQENYDERGLLGVAFSPSFGTDNKFYVYYSAPLRGGAPEGFDHTSRISEFTVSNSNPDKADLSSERIILEIDQPQFNHNGGEILFGPDGYLYVAVGDGGNADDFGLGHSETGNAQDLKSPLGKILRIDTDGGIPADNPFHNEIYAYGFRNPFRMSFDRKTGELFVGDVGQNLWEEVDIVEKGKNYGWNIKEGNHCFSHESPDDSPADCRNVGYNGEELAAPILEYDHSQGISLIGGFVYRGKEIPKLYGKYVFGDWSGSFTSAAGKIFVAEPSAQTKTRGWTITHTKEINSFVLGFGEDENGELYLLTSNEAGPAGNTGKIYKIVK
ncbi:MAG TPA: PQQ-dependent sugar dehydrogenase [Candidatus Colwellbacteria bacterium]|nr:PQQ-dependent sugar dehydrogenase [Candidatus Colwellbacteria bacterium]